MRIMIPREGEVRIPSGCAISGIMDRSGARHDGSDILKSISLMHDRSNGLGGGFAAYGIYPDYKDFYAFHMLYESKEARTATEAFFDTRFECEKQEVIPTDDVKSIKHAPLIWRYFLKPDPVALLRSELDEDEYVMRCVFHINSNIPGAFVASSGKNMGAFKGVGYPEEIGEFLEEMKHETFDKYDAFTVGEVFNEKDSELREFIGENGHFSSKFDFAPEICGKGGAWYEHETVTPEMYKNAIFDSQLRVADIGFLSNIIENHDEPRGVCRYIPDGDLNDTSKKALAAVYFFLRGIPFIYQGQEIGMENCPFESIDQIDDISSKDEYKVCRDAGYSEEESMKLLRVYSRDNARTPVQWSDEENAGFSTHKPWMIVNPNYREINLAKQKDDRNSVYTFYKQMIALYKDPAYHETLTFGRFEPYMRETKNLIAYYRKGEGQTLLVLANFQNEPQTVMLPEAAGNVILNNCASVDVDDNGSITLGGYQAVMIEL